VKAISPFSFIKKAPFTPKGVIKKEYKNKFVKLAKKNKKKIYWSFSCFFC
jgi:hypothetical protein